MNAANQAEHGSDVEGLDRLAEIVTSELNKLGKQDAQLDHLRALSAASVYSPELAWKVWPKSNFHIRFVRLPSGGVRELRSRLRAGTLKINSAHPDFILRLERGRNIGPRLVSYVANVAASYYEAPRRDRSQESSDSTSRPVDHFLELACQLEDRVLRRLSAHLLKTLPVQNL